MSDKNPIESIDGLTQGSGIEKLDKPFERKETANHAHFDALMEQKNQPQEEVRPDAAKPRLEDVARTANEVKPIEEITPSNIVEETRKTVTTIEEIKHKLEDKLVATDPNLNKSYNPILRNKLTHIDDQLKIALSRAGAEQTNVEAIEPSAAREKINPVQRFLDHLGHAQYQLESLGTYIEGVQQSGGEFTAATLLAVQLKVNKVQQELEFFSNMLNKALESTKTIMNVQI